jgi:hypothetical protein
MAPPRGLVFASLYAMRAGYLFMGLGLAIVKWPHLPDASHLPMYELVTLCTLTPMPLLAFLGLRYRARCCRCCSSNLVGSCSGWASSPSPEPPAQASTPPHVRCVKNSLVVVILAVIPCGVRSFERRANLGVEAGGRIDRRGETTS